MLAAKPVNTVNAVRQGGSRMATMERWTQVFTSDKAWTIQIENEQQWDAIEQRLGGFPAKRRYRPVEDREEGGVLIWEREWENSELMDAAYERLMSSAEVKALGEETRARLQAAGLDKLVADGTREYFLVLD
jgi:hypothetical protein